MQPRDKIRGPGRHKQRQNEQQNNNKGRGSSSSHSIIGLPDVNTNRRTLRSVGSNTKEPRRFSFWWKAVATSSPPKQPNICNEKKVRGGNPVAPSSKHGTPNLEVQRSIGINQLHQQPRPAALPAIKLQPCKREGKGGGRHVRTFCTGSKTSIPYVAAIRRVVLKNISLFLNLWQPDA